jgi:hypothetical protein
MGGNVCSMQCQEDWYQKFGEQAINHFGRTHEPKRTECDEAWYKYRDWRGYNNTTYYFVNDLLGERQPITEQQYNDDKLTQPS